MTNLHSRRAAAVALSVGVLVAFAGDSRAQRTISRDGTTAAQFLEIGVGARAEAMGGAFATATDVSALYWNPAGAAAMTSNEAMFTYTSWLAGVKLNYAAFALNLGRVGTVGASVYRMGSGNMAVTTELQPDGTGQTFEVVDAAVGLTYARQMSDQLSLGGSAKYIHSDIARSSASGIAFDIGLQYATPLRGVRLGMAITNFGNGLQVSGPDVIVRTQVSDNGEQVISSLGTQQWELPLGLRFGVGYEPIKRDNVKLTVSSDVLYPNNANPFVNAGAEVGYRDLLFARAGLRELFLDSRDGASFSLGGGLKAYDVKFDYAFTDMGRLPNVQRLTLGVEF